MWSSNNSTSTLWTSPNIKCDCCSSTVRIRCVFNPETQRTEHVIEEEVPTNNEQEQDLNLDIQLALIESMFPNKSQENHVNSPSSYETQSHQTPLDFLPISSTISHETHQPTNTNVDLSSVPSSQLASESTQTKTKKKVFSFKKNTDKKSQDSNVNTVQAPMVNNNTPPSDPSQSPPSDFSRTKVLEAKVEKRVLYSRRMENFLDIALQNLDAESAGSRKTYNDDDNFKDNETFLPDTCTDIGLYLKSWTIDFEFSQLELYSRVNGRVIIKVKSSELESDQPGDAYKFRQRSSGDFAIKKCCMPTMNIFNTLKIKVNKSVSVKIPALVSYSQDPFNGAHNKVIFWSDLVGLISLGRFENPKVSKGLGNDYKIFGALKVIRLSLECPYREHDSFAMEPDAWKITDYGDDLPPSHPYPKKPIRLDDLIVDRRRSTRTRQYFCSATFPEKEIWSDCQQSLVDDDVTDEYLSGLFVPICQGPTSMTWRALVVGPKKLVLHATRERFHEYVQKHRGCKRDDTGEDIAKRVEEDRKRVMEDFERCCFMSTTSV